MGTSRVDALDVNSLVFRYGEVTALDHVSLRVPAGRFVALLGANGAGKSTLFSIITGLYSALEGVVSVTGYNLRADTLSALSAMGVVFQRSTLDMDLNVLQNLQYAAALQGLPRTISHQRIDQALERHDLTEFSKRKVSALSGGQRRRVELARALLHEPRLLLLDEPTVGLDIKSRTEFVEHVKRLCAEDGTGVLWATHLMDEVAESDLVTVLEHGRVIADGEVRSLQEQHSVDSVQTLYRTLTGSAR
ncbi:MAG: ATP-binding cassette domain-containing protein [Gammaproteobacteria bacterium]|nr:ATP-binding cassette domain-containing protein [Gammaproteobacteria bacterium]